MKTAGYFKQQAARARQMAQSSNRPELIALLERLARNFEDMALSLKA